MKTALITIGKIILQFAIWAALIALLDQFSFAIDKQERILKTFLYEAFPLLFLLVAIYMVGHLLDKFSFSFIGLGKEGLVKETIAGLLWGMLWVALSTGLLIAFTSSSFTSGNQLPLLHVATYFLILYINAASQEILVHGYTFGLLKKTYGKPAALITTSLLFLLLHPGAIEAGVVASINVFSAGMFFGLLLLFTNRLWKSIAVHATWNYLHSVVFGLLPLSSYPSLKLIQREGEFLWVGGKNGIEEGLFVSISIFLVFMIYLAVFRKTSKKIFQ